MAFCSLLLLAGPAAAAPPTGGTQGADGITATGANLNAFLFSDDGSVTYHFEYGTTAAYGSSTPNKTVTTSGSGTQVSEPVSGLTPNTTYHFRVIATNTSGTLTGNDATFTTQSPPPPADTDQDGVPDSQDACPGESAQGSANGCAGPDRDRDKISDSRDSCPDYPGTAANHGCPPDCPGGNVMTGDFDRDGRSNNCDTDDDNDGLPDADEGASAQNAYDQDPDIDRDGVLDGADVCRKLPVGTFPSRFRGCPVFSFQGGSYPHLPAWTDKGGRLLFFGFCRPYECTVSATFSVSKKTRKALKLESRVLGRVTDTASQRNGGLDIAPPTPKAVRSKLSKRKSVEITVTLKGEVPQTAMTDKARFGFKKTFVLKEYKKLDRFGSPIIPTADVDKTSVFYPDKATATGRRR